MQDHRFGLLIIASRRVRRSGIEFLFTRRTKAGCACETRKSYTNIKYRFEKRHTYGETYQSIVHFRLRDRHIDWLVLRSSGNGSNSRWEWTAIFP